MKRSLLVLLLLCSSSIAFSQGNTYVSAGLGIPSKPVDLQRDWSAGFSLGAGFEAPLSDWFLVTAGFDLTTFPLNEQSFLQAQGVAGTGIGVSGGSVSVLTVMGGPKLRFVQVPKLFSAYVVGLLGYMNFTKKELEVAQNDQVVGKLAEEERPSFCLGGGAGIDVPLGKNTGAFIEGRYVYGTRESSPAFVPIRVGLHIRL